MAPPRSARRGPAPRPGVAGPKWPKLRESALVVTNLLSGRQDDRIFTRSAFVSHVPVLVDAEGLVAMALALPPSPACPLEASCMPCAACLEGEDCPEARSRSGSLSPRRGTRLVLMAKGWRELLSDDDAISMIRGWVSSAPCAESGTGELSRSRGCGTGPPPSANNSVKYRWAVKWSSKWWTDELCARLNPSLALRRASGSSSHAPRPGFPLARPQPPRERPGV
jgi:hypothetical protein